MIDRLPEKHPFFRIASTLEASRHPLSSWVRTSLVELYKEGNGEYVRTKGPVDENLKYQPVAFRIVALHDENFKGIDLTIGENDTQDNELIQELRDELALLPNFDPPIPATDRLCKNALLPARKQTLGALELSRTTDGQPVVQILNLKILRATIGNFLRNNGIGLTEEQDRDGTSNMVLRYLKNTPIGSFRLRNLMSY